MTGCFGECCGQASLCGEPFVASNSNGNGNGNGNAAQIPQFLLATTLVAVETDTKADTEGNDNNDDDTNQEAPPLELTGAAGMVCGDLDLLVALLHIVDGVFGIVLGARENRILLFDHDSQLLVQRGKFGKSLFNVLQFVVACANVAKQLGGMSGTILLELEGSQ